MEHFSAQLIIFGIIRKATGVNTATCFILILDPPPLCANGMSVHSKSEDSSTILLASDVRFSPEDMQSFFLFSFLFFQDILYKYIYGF